MAALTEDDVRQIRQRYAAGGVTQQQLALEYGVDRTNISFIIRRKTWTHINEQAENLEQETRPPGEDD